MYNFVQIFFLQCILIYEYVCAPKIIQIERGNCLEPVWNWWADIPRGPRMLQIKSASTEIFVPVPVSCVLCLGSGKDLG